MSRISSEMDLMILGVLLLLSSGAVFAYQVENGTVGRSVYFYESVPAEDNPAIQWIFRDAIVAQRFPGATPVCVGQYLGRCEMYANGTLRLDRLTSADEGMYTMTAQYPNSTIIKKSTFDLRVYTPVSDVKITSSVPGLVWPGIDSVSLTCTANGTGITYSWNLQGVPLPNVSRYHLTENNRVLTITPVTVNDTGTFTCTASSLINSETSNGINLTLGSKISEVALTSNISEGQYLLVGEESAFLHCYADGSNVTFIWKLNGENVPRRPPYYQSEGESPSHSNLLISPVSKTDAGPFTCEASNRLGNQTSNDLNFSLAWKPEGNINCSALPDGGGIKLGCSWPGGHPAANVTLDFNGKTEKGMNNVTSQVSIDGNFQGSNLTCHGDQLGRKSQCTVNIRLPEAQRHNNNTITNTSIGGKLNLTVTLEPGLPATFKWHRNISNQSKAQAVISSTDFSSSYLIQVVTESDGGEYVCTAENIIGTQSFRFTVNVEKYGFHPPPKKGLSGGEIAGIVIGVLAGVAIIGIAVFFIVRKKKRSGDNKRINEPDDQLGANVTYATVQKPNGGVAETSLTNNQEDDVKYAELKFPNNKSTMATVPPPVETEYSTVKTSIKQ